MKRDGLVPLPLLDWGLSPGPRMTTHFPGGITCPSCRQTPCLYGLPRMPPQTSFLSASATRVEGTRAQAEDQIWRVTPRLPPGAVLHSILFPCPLFHPPQPSFSSLTLFWPASGFSYRNIHWFHLLTDACRPWARVLCARRAAVIQCVTHAHLCWRDQHGTRYIQMSLQYACGELAVFMHIFCGSTAWPGFASGSVCCVWCAIPKPRVSVCVVGPLCAVYRVCLCAYHVCLCYLPFVYCTWLECPCGVMCLHTCVSTCPLYCLARWDHRIVCICVCWAAFVLWFRSLWSCVWLSNLLVVCVVYVGCIVFAVCAHAACFSVSLSLWNVSVSPASSSSPSSAPASLPPVSSLGCDQSQLTPSLLWQPKNGLEKGQLATFSLGLPRSQDSGVVWCGSALCWLCGPQMASATGASSSLCRSPPRDFQPH